MILLGGVSWRRSLTKISSQSTMCVRLGEHAKPFCVSHILKTWIFEDGTSLKLLILLFFDTRTHTLSLSSTQDFVDGDMAGSSTGANWPLYTAYSTSLAWGFFVKLFSSFTPELGRSHRLFFSFPHTSAISLSNTSNTNCSSLSPRPFVLKERKRGPTD